MGRFVELTEVVGKKCRNDYNPCPHSECTIAFLQSDHSKQGFIISPILLTSYIKA